MDLVQLENVQICEGADDWRDAIRKSAILLEQHGYVEPRYKEEIISNIEKLGPYIVVADDVALPHARPEQGALKTQIGVTLFREDIPFENGGSTARLFVTLAAQDSSLHQDALMKISELLGDEETVAQILDSPDVEALYRYFQ